MQASFFARFEHIEWEMVLTYLTSEIDSFGTRDENLFFLFLSMLLVVVVVGCALELVILEKFIHKFNNNND